MLRLLLFFVCVFVEDKFVGCSGDLIEVRFVAAVVVDVAGSHLTFSCGSRARFRSGRVRRGSRLHLPR